MRFVGSLPNVKVILSGMSDASQVMDNISTFRDFKPLSEAERAALDTAVETLKARVKNPCTGCGYCQPCPKGINIPRIFQAYTYHNVYGLHELAKKTYLSYVNDEKKPGATSKDCVGCGYCERKCPQHLKVRELLKKVEGVLEAL